MSSGAMGQAKETQLSSLVRTQAQKNTRKGCHDRHDVTPIKTICKSTTSGRDNNVTITSNGSDGPSRINSCKYQGCPCGSSSRIMTQTLHLRSGILPLHPATGYSPSVNNPLGKAAEKGGWWDAVPRNHGLH